MNETASPRLEGERLTLRPLTEREAGFTREGVLKSNWSFEGRRIDGVPMGRVRDA